MTQETRSRSDQDERLQLLNKVADSKRMPRLLRGYARLEAAPHRWANDFGDRTDARIQARSEHLDASIESSKARNAARLNTALGKLADLRATQDGTHVPNLPSTHPEVSPERAVEGTPPLGDEAVAHIAFTLCETIGAPDIEQPTK